VDWSVLRSPAPPADHGQSGGSRAPDWGGPLTGSREEPGAGADSSLHDSFCRSPRDVRSEGLKQWAPSEQAGPPVPLITVFLLYRFIPKNTALSSPGGSGERASELLSRRGTWAETRRERGGAQRSSPSLLSPSPSLSASPSFCFSFPVSFVSFLFILLVKGSGLKNHLPAADRSPQR